MITTQANFKAVGNCAFISLPSATKQGYERESGIYIPAANGRQEECAAVVGTVVAANPMSYKNSQGRHSFELQEGEQVAVDYLVTADGEQTEGGFVHHNAWLINDQLVWLTRPERVIAVYRNNEWQAVGDRILLEQIKGNAYESDSILIPDLATGVLAGRGTFVSGDLNISRETIVVFDQSKSDVYQFSDGIEYIVVSKAFVFGYIS